MTNGYTELANAIVLQAVKDYRKAIKVLKKHPQNEVALLREHEILQFFHSDWYQLLTNVDPEVLINKTLEEVES